MIHRGKWLYLHHSAVVNCFQISTLVDDSQAIDLWYCYLTGCELLSDFYFSR